MEPGSGRGGRGRGRGRLPKSSPAGPGADSPQSSLSSSPDGSEKSFCSSVASTSTSQLGRGRGRGISSLSETCNTSSSPVPPPNNPEEEGFLAEFRKLMKKGRGRGGGFPFNTCPSVESSLDSGFVSSRGRGLSSTPIRAPSTSAKFPNPTAATESETSSCNETGSEDYSELEKATIIKRGEKGRQVPVIANYLRLNIAKNRGFYEYHVDFEPPLESFRLKKKLLKNLEEKLGQARTFDGAKLYLAKELPNKVSKFFAPHPVSSDETVSVVIKYVKKNNLTECIHFYNVLFRRVMESLGLVEMKRYFFNHKAVFDFPEHKLEIWPGYITAVDEYEGGLMLCCDSSFRVLRTATVLDTWNSYLMGEGRGRGINQVKRDFAEYILGKIIVTKYNNRNYRIDDVDWEKTPMSTFTNSKGETISFFNYYKNAYNISIRDKTQPLIVHRPKPNEQGVIPLICLVPELCYTTGMDSSVTSNYTIMRDLAQHTKLSPERRNLALQEYVKNVNQCPEAVSMLKIWGLALEDAAVRLEGRVLTVPQITLSQKCQFHPDKANFGDKVLHNAIYDPVLVRNWLLFFSKHDRDRASRMSEIYSSVTRAFGISFQNTKALINVGNGTIQNYQQHMERCLRQNPQCQFVVVIIPSARDDMYGMIKKLCTLVRPIPSQVILSKTLGNEKKFRAIIQKVALQINCKLGGSLWAIRIPLPEKIMFIGMDVYHDPRKKNKSVTAIVATLNHTHTKYYSRVLFQQSHQETISSLLPILMDIMIAYNGENNCFPDRIIVWRDGVNDGQLEMTKAHEVSQMMEAFKRLGISPKFTFCVVQKRINARFFLQERQGLVNPNPGTVVDHSITRKYLYDFFLVSQLIGEGTVTPTHYIVLEDNADIQPDLIQKFAFCNTFMYYNWTGSIRVPAMCQYAHKLASLVGQYVQAEPSMDLVKNLYYL